MSETPMNRPRMEHVYLPSEKGLRFLMQYEPIGGSEAAAACGLDPYKSQVRLYLEKRGEVAPRDESEAATWGKLLQPVVAERLGVMGWETMPAPDVAITHESRPWMSGHLDGYVKYEGADAPGIAASAIGSPPDSRGILEIKTTGAWNAHLWAEGETPNAVVLQVHHYMVLTGLEWALVAALIGGQRLVTRYIAREDNLIAAMLELEQGFWKNLHEGTIPPPDGSPATAEAILALYPTAEAGAVVHLTEADIAMIREYKYLCESAKETKRQADEIKQALQLRMGANELALYDGEPRLRWSAAHRKGYTVEAKDYRRFTVL